MTKLRKCLSKNLAASCFASSGQANKHNSVSNDHGFKQLNNFLNVFGRSLVFNLPQLILNSFLELTIIDERNDNTWEQIIHDTLEQRKIVLKELRDIGISHSTNEDNIFLD
jgi:hypothetical protein